MRTAIIPVFIRAVAELVSNLYFPYSSKCNYNHYLHGGIVYSHMHVWLDGFGMCLHD